ncbi:Protein trichome birefringence-like 3, partial [Cucurbita argyrosperma subsp. sororia]
MSLSASFPSALMTSKCPITRLKPRLPFLTVVLCAFSFLALLYTERITFFSSISIFKLKSCPRKPASSKTREKPMAEERSTNPLTDDRFEFDPEECNIANGKWVFNRSMKPLYTDRSCPYLDRQVSCVKNGRVDSDYRRWEWQPEDCTLPRFDAEIALNKMRGKRVMFVGDSLQRGQWQSFVCMVEWMIPADKKSLNRGSFLSVFTAKEYNATIEFYWAPFLVHSNSDNPIIGDPKQRILRVDSVANHSKHWTNVDILVFNSYVWWMSVAKIKSLWGSFKNGEEGYVEFDTPIAYTMGMKTWANWVDSNVNPNMTRVFFTTMSPTHTRSMDWGRVNGSKCFNETKPIRNRNFWGSGSDKGMMSVVSKIVNKMKVPVTFINITQLSDYRIDAHSSIFTETGGKLLTAEQKADPLRHADCIHWCLPGVPDTWNQILFAHL